MHNTPACASQRSAILPQPHHRASPNFPLHYMRCGCELRVDVAGPADVRRRKLPLGIPNPQRPAASVCCHNIDGAQRARVGFKDGQQGWILVSAGPSICSCQHYFKAKSTWWPTLRGNTEVGEGRSHVGQQSQHCMWMARRVLVGVGLIDRWGFRRCFERQCSRHLKNKRYRNALQSTLDDYINQVHSSPRPPPRSDRCAMPS